MVRNSFIFQKTPSWLCVRAGVHVNIPADVASWVFESNSLTARLRGYYQDQFAVKILFHQWRPAFLDETRQLHQTPRKYYLVREVLLHSGETPLILARTILPEKTIKIARRNLSHLGTRPLGEVIFSYPGLERLQLEVSRVSDGYWNPQITAEIRENGTVWGRRTVYAIHQQPLLVSEFFLQGALQIS